MSYLPDMYGIVSEAGEYIEISSNLTTTKRWATKLGLEFVYKMCGGLAIIVARKRIGKWENLEKGIK